MGACVRLSRRICTLSSEHEALPGPHLRAAGARGMRGRGARDRQHQQQVWLEGLHVDPDADLDRQHDLQADEQEDTAQLHRQERGRAVGDLDQDRRATRHDHPPEPQRRRAVAARRPEAQARAVIRRGILSAAVCAAALVPCAAAHAAPPAITAPEAILVEPQTQDVVYARHAGMRRPMASTTKLMTALLTLEHTHLSDVFTAAPYSPAAGESLMGLRTGERLTVADLLRGLLIVSANDAAHTLAVDVAGSQKRFVRMMNRRARELGLHDTHYANPVGLDAPGNYSSAADLVKLALVLRQNAFFRATTNMPTATLHSGSRVRRLVNRNTLVRTVPYVSGVKTGHTNSAGYVLVGSATRGGVTLLSAVLGDSSEATRDSDSLRLLRYGLSRYHRVEPVRRGARFGDTALKYRDTRVDLVAARSLLRVARRGERITTHVTGAPSEIEGPMAKGTKVGTIVVRQRGRVIGRVPLVTARDIAAPTLGQRLGDYLDRSSTRAVLAVLAACSLYLALMRRRLGRRRDGAEGP